MATKDGTTPAGESAAAAGASADSAAASAASAAESEAQVRALAQLVVQAALAPVLADIAILKTVQAKAESDEAADDAQTTKLQDLLSTLQEQILWVTCAALLVGAAIGYVLLRIFG